MSNCGFWSNPFCDADVALRQQQARDRLGAGAVTEYRPLKWAFLLGTDAADFGSANQPALYNVIERANDKATQAGPTDTTAANSGYGANTTKPSEPKIDAQGLVPSGTMILMGGIGVVVITPLVVARAAVAPASSPAGTYEAAAAADDQVAGIQAAFDCSMIRILDARNEKAQATGHEAVSYGTFRAGVYGPPVQTADGLVSSMLYSGQVQGKDRGWCRFSQPISFDGGGNGYSQSQIGLYLEVPRSTAWPIRTATRIRVEVMAPSLVSYLGSAGNVACDPMQGTPPQVQQPPLPPYGYIPPKQRW